jgi:predicted RNA-binding protein with PUA-like domain
VAGTAVVARTAYPDFTALDPSDHHYDPKATREQPIWEMVDVKLERVFPREISLDELRATPGLKGMELLRRGSRLSVQPVSEEHFEIVLKLVEQPAPSDAKPTATQPRRRLSPPTAKKGRGTKAAKKPVKRAKARR